MLPRATLILCMYVFAIHFLAHVFGLSLSKTQLLGLHQRISKSARRLIVRVPIIATCFFPVKVGIHADLIQQITSTAASREPSGSQLLNRAQSPRNLEFLFVRNAAQNVGPSVVRIDCDREVLPMMSMFSETFREGDVMKVSGTGIIGSADGYIITNAHVVDHAKRVTVTLSNGRTFKATVTASDEFTDLAVIKIDPTGVHGCPLTPAPVGDSSTLQSGDWVIAVGCPVGLDFTVTLGVVSNPKRSAAEVGAPHLKGTYIQTDAALNSGNSGGPLVNDQGEVIGINTMVRTNTEAIGFAIPINRVTHICNVLKTGKKPSHAFFGMKVTSITPDNVRIHNEDPNSQRLFETRGALVMHVTPGAPADTCGLRKLDIVTAVNGQSVTCADEAEDLLDGVKPGTCCRIQVLRGEHGRKVELEAAPMDLHAMLEEERKRPLPQPPMVLLRPKL